MALAELATLEHGQRADLQRTAQGGPIGPPPLSTDEAAKLAGVGASTIKRAKIVLKYGTPEEIEAAGTGGAGVDGC